ncbi:MAG TPA: hypothetical protein VFP64_12850 [Pyrinomonadaceae bacterium]|nr:hypothetical protein [Pyrinomonadaceae bacterium]
MVQEKIGGPSGMTTGGPLCNRGAMKFLQTKFHNVIVKRSVELTGDQSDWSKFGYERCQIDWLVLFV